MQEISIDALLRLPIVQTVGLPLFVGFGFAGLFRLFDRKGEGPTCWGAVLAGAAVPLGVLLAMLLIVGFPGVPPILPDHKILWLLPALVALGLLLDLRRIRPALRVVIALAVATVALAWIAQPFVARGDLGVLLGLALAVPLAGLVLTRVGGAAEQGAVAPVLLTVAALGLAAVIAHGGTYKLAQIAGALGFAAFGFLVWNWPVPRFRFGATLLLGAGVPLVLLAFAAILHSDTRPSAVILLSLLAFADRALDTARLTPQFGASLRDNLLGTSLVFAVALIPAIAAVLLAWTLSPGLYLG